MIPVLDFVVTTLVFEQLSASIDTRFFGVLAVSLLGFRLIGFVWRTPTTEADP